MNLPTPIKFMRGWEAYVLNHLDGHRELKSSGRMVSPIKQPRPEDICLEDITHCLARLCRWGGDTDGFYSVAQHSVLVASILPRHLQVAGLLHDATEAYISDIPKPAKRSLPEYDLAEERLAQVIFQHFRVPFENLGKVKEADLIVLAAEARDLFTPKRDFIFDTPIRLFAETVGHIEPLNYLAAEELFRQRADELGLTELG